MANAQVLVLVRSSAPLTPAQIQGPIEAAARAAGFVPGPWAFDTQSVRLVPTAGGGTVASGPWGLLSTMPPTPAETVSETIPAAGSNLVFNAYRQNFLNGPDPATVASWPFSSAAVGAALRSLPGVSSTRISFRAPGNAISWDRGIPTPISLVATSPTPASNGLFWGILAIAGVAYVASRGTAAKPMAMGRLGKLSTNREGLTFEQWRRAAAVPASTPGVHAAWVKGEDPSDWRAMHHAVTVASRTRLQGLRRW